MATNKVELNTTVELKTPKFSNRLHLVYNLVYVPIICALIILTIILTTKAQVGDVAFQNFSFAATLVSIVLAVVSIVFSIYSGLNIAKYYANFDHVEHKLEKEVGEMANIKKQIDTVLKHTKNTEDAVKDLIKNTDTNNSFRFANNNDSNNNNNNNNVQ